MGETKEHIKEWIEREEYAIHSIYHADMDDCELLQLLEHAHKLQRYIEKLLGGEYND